MGKYTALNNYPRYLRNNFKQCFPCSFCGLQILPEMYEKHCTNEKHDIDVKNSCVWCVGNVQWEKGKKFENMDHIYQCIENFFNPRAIISSPFREEESIPISLFDLTPEFETKHFFGHPRIEQPINTCHFWIPDNNDPFRELNYALNYDIPETYILNFPLEIITTMRDANRLIFKCENLNRAMYYLRYYLSVKTIRWYHVMIRRIAFASFLEAMEKFDRGGQTKILHYYCWCSGGPSNLQDIYKQHVHLIIVTRENHFVKYVWSSVKPHDKPHRNYKCKYSKPIESPLHLVNAMGYVSRRRSRCRFAKKKSSEEEEDSFKHFYLNGSLPKDYRYALVTQWDEGIVQLVKYLYQNFEPLPHIYTSLEYAHRRWEMKFKHLPNLIQNLVLPVRSNFIPTTNKITNAYFNLYDGKRLYFEEYPEQSVVFTPREQADAGNLFTKAVEDAIFVLRPKCQRVNNKIQRSLNVAMRTKNEEIERLQKLVQSQREEIEDLKARLYGT